MFDMKDKRIRLNLAWDGMDSTGISRWGSPGSGGVPRVMI